MPIIDSRKIAQEGLVEAAKLAVLSLHKAPQLTGRTEVKAVVVTGEAFQPMLDVMGEIEAMGFDGLLKFPFAPLMLDYFCYKTAIAEGWDPVVIILGADLTVSETGWDCGGCGFPSCNRFNKFARSNKTPGPLLGLGLGEGPSCVLKMLDFSIACDYVTATLHNLNVETRAQGTFAILAQGLGYIEGVSCCLCNPVGPIAELFWYSRRPLGGMMPSSPGELPDMIYQMGLTMLRERHPDAWEALPALTHPWLKGPGKWWERPREYIHVGPDAEIDQHEKEITETFIQAVENNRGKVKNMREEGKL